MTSRISFVNKLKEELKHHVVSIFVVTVVMLFQLISFHFSLRSIMMQTGVSRITIIEDALSMVEPNFGKNIPYILLAVFMAMEYFSYLHSKKKSDFYMALPIQRGAQFALGACTCAIVFAVPFLMEKVIEIVLVFVSGCGTALFLQNILWNVVCVLLSMMTSWVTMSLLMVATGNTTIAFVLYGVVGVYIPFMIKNLVPTFRELFCTTYYEISGYGKWWEYFSPITLSSELSGYYEEWHLNNHMADLFANIIFIFIVGTIAYLLYKKRPAEAAGRAMAFEKVNPIIRYLLVIPVALYFGVILNEMSMLDSKIWLGGGILLGATLMHGIMESVFAFDIKKMFTKKRALVISLIVCACFCGYFYLGTETFDSYIPEESSIEKIYIGIEDGTVTYDNVINYDDENWGIGSENIRPVLSLVQNAIEQNNQTKNSEKEISERITIIYKLSDGKMQARRYQIPISKKENRALIDIIYATKEFKDDYYDIYDAGFGEKCDITIDAMLKDVKLSLSNEELEEFINSYLKDFDKMTYTQLLEENRIASIEFAGTNKYMEKELQYYYIYENFEHTIAFLEKHGIKVTCPFAEYEVLELDLYNDETNKTLKITDKEKINSIKDEIIIEEYYMGNDFYMYGLNGVYYGNAQVNVNGRIEDRYVMVREEIIE